MAHAFLVAWIGCVVGSSLAAQTTTRVNVSTAGTEANDWSFGSTISADGRYAAFSSYATNLVPSDANGLSDVFVHDSQLGVTEIVSVDSNGQQNACAGCIGGYWCSMSADGRYVAFDSQESLDAADAVPASWDVFVRDRASGTTSIASLGQGGLPGTGASRWPAISADGRFVVFVSDSANLVAGDTNGFADAFVRDRTTGAIQRASVSSAGVQANNSTQPYVSISADGRFVAFVSAASNLAPGGGNMTVFVRDTVAQTTTIASQGINGSAADANSWYPTISGDGRMVAFMSPATNLLSSTVGSEAWNSRDLKSRPH